MLNRRFRGTDEAGHRGVTERTDYLIDRFRVRYAFGGGWACGCADFAAADACRHTREAAGRYIAQALIAAHLDIGAARTLTFNSGAYEGTLRRQLLHSPGGRTKCPTEDARVPLLAA
jgi:hypothetical protein